MLVGWRARLAGDCAAALESSRRLVALAPKSQFAVTLARDASCLNRSREAVVALRRLDPTEPWVAEWPDYWANLAYQLHQLGDYREELSVALAARRVRPELLRYLWLELQARAALGEVENVRRGLDESLGLSSPRSVDQGVAWVPGMVMRNVALELRAHGHRAAARQAIARAITWYEANPSADPSGPEGVTQRLHRLWEAERWTEASAVADSRLAADTDVAEHHATAGIIAAQRGDRSRAMREWTWLRERSTLPRRAEASYLSSHIAAVLGDRPGAVRLLADAYALGWRHTYYDHLQASFETLVDYPAYRELMRPRE